MEDALTIFWAGFASGIGSFFSLYAVLLSVCKVFSWLGTSVHDSEV